MSEKAQCAKAECPKVGDLLYAVFRCKPPVYYSVYDF